MRLLAAERVIRGLVLYFVAFLIIRFRGNEQELKDTFNNDVTLFRPVADQLGWNLDDSKIVRGISRVFEFSPATLTWITVGVIAYGTLQLVESYGLWTMRRWGEYLDRGRHQHLPAVGDLRGHREGHRDSGSAR